jgi:hypothetical protein
MGYVASTLPNFDICLHCSDSKPGRDCVNSSMRKCNHPTPNSEERQELSTTGVSKILNYAKDKSPTSCKASACGSVLHKADQDEACRLKSGHGLRHYAAFKSHAIVCSIQPTRRTVEDSNSGSWGSEAGARTVGAKQAVLAHRPVGKACGSKPSCGMEDRHGVCPEPTCSCS